MSMAKFMAPYEKYTYAALRIVAGLLFFFHGAQKLLNWPLPATPDMVPFVIYVAGPIELLGGILVMIGLMTRWAAFISSGLMAGAYWMAHAPHSLYPIINKGDFAIMFCFAFLYIAARGPGIWSVDAMRGQS
jgi:putative oxidoreductase